MSGKRRAGASVFLDVPHERRVAENDLAFAIPDAYPVSRGHTLVVPKRVVATWFEATAEEQRALMELVADVKRQLDRLEPRPDGYNVGFNAGEAAGQTVMHLHVHVIPRFRGDVDDPRGGVRHVIPGRGNYLRAPPLATGGEKDPFARHILPLFDRAHTIAIVAAFVQDSGLRKLEPYVDRALRRGARIEIITGDYLEITQVSALERLLDWQSASIATDDEVVAPGSLEVRIIESAGLEGRTKSFHPKSWRFERVDAASAFVGSSNLSFAALDTAIEWNLRVDRERDAAAYTRVCEAFADLWRRARALDATWLALYAARAALRPQSLPPWELDAEPVGPLPDPHPVQVEALAQLRDTRASGRKRALVVLATGLGKTMLAALDFEQVRAESGRTPRLLFVAHRRELLVQAARTFRQLFLEKNVSASIGWFAEDRASLNADVVFAQVAKLGRREHAEKLRAETFDYVVVDEVHHATAASYRNILGALEPGFLLGLTATPDRADEADVLGLFDDHVAYRAGIDRGIELGRLVPFHYHGVRDDIDYANIPWRNRRFDPEDLARAAQTEARMETMWRAWSAHPGKRTLVFCCSVAHATFVRDWLRERGVRANAIFSAPGSDERERSLTAILAGELDAICAVDVLNEGVDLPALDRVVMLRPTESGVVFLQQLGRGLRRPMDGDKTSLTVIDFVGNHRVFLERMRTLLALGESSSTEGVRRFLEGSATAELPEGCSVELELEAKELLARLWKSSGANEVERAYRELRGLRDARPTAGELLRMGYLVAKLRERHGSWFDFVRGEGDLDAEETSAHEISRAFLREIETTRMTKSFKMVVLQALVESDAVATGMELSALARKCHAILRRTPDLWEDVAQGERADELGDDASKWIGYWRRNPIEAWTTEGGGARAWFRLEHDRFELNLQLPPASAGAFTQLIAELVDYRLAEYRRRAESTGEGFTCRVTWNQRDPILKLPSRAAGRGLPMGEADVRLSDGSVWVFRFAKEFCNVAHPAGQTRNQLPDLLRRWFGPSAGQPSTAFAVRFHASPDGLWVEPERDAARAIPIRGRSVVAYPDLKAAAGHGLDRAESVERSAVSLPVDSPDDSMFAVRVSGDSMDGGRTPLRDGDWAVFRVARGLPASAVDGRVALVQVHEEGEGTAFRIKRIAQRDGRWWLDSDNPAIPPREASGDATVVARFDRSFSPDGLGPSVGDVLTPSELGERFGIGADELETRTGRYGGHLFGFVDQKGQLTAPDLVKLPGVVRRPGETAFVLSKRADATWRYAGVGRWEQDRASWRVPEVDHETWRTWGDPDAGVSRALPDGARAKAQVAADTLLALKAGDRWIARDDGSGERRARVVARAPRGGLRIDGGEGGFAERTVSLVDLAWAIVADDDRETHGGILDEARVNRVRYLEGTPKGSTRWIDTGWALAAWARAKPLIPLTAEPIQIVDDRGKPLDARFLVERDPGGATSVIIESRGGTKGTPAERNTEYHQGFELVLTRLQALGAVIHDAIVDSRDTRDRPDADRRLVLDRTYPLHIDDPPALRRELGRAQARLRRPGAKGAGNSTKRVRLRLTFESSIDLEQVASALRRGER